MNRLSLLTLVALVAMCSIAAAGQSAGKRKESEVLLGRAQEWVDTWNDKDLAKLRGLHGAEVRGQLYGIGERFGTVEKLIDDIERANWWGLSWSIMIVDPSVRKLGTDSALVAFRLVGKETDSRGGSRVYSGAYSLILERQKKIWYVTHVHSSTGPVPGSD